ncbi:MAG: Uncharacterised protein [Cryomorphaceae bacterium]|nr:MAG: Uncharacterised protein [Cryomorphaceae bacterium]
MLLTGENMTYDYAAKPAFNRLYFSNAFHLKTGVSEEFIHAFWIESYGEIALQPIVRNVHGA